VAVLRLSRFLCSRFDLSGFRFGCFYIWNSILTYVLAEKLSIPQRAIVLERGERSRDKVIRINRLSDEEPS
jgi:hypothetical protein